MELKEYIGEEEWENFQPDHELSPDVSEKLWNTITKNTAPPKVHYPYFKWTAVAASVLLAIGLSWHFTLKKQKASIINAATNATVAKTKNVFNNTARKMTLVLSDGSTVELLPNSTLIYPESFNSLKRDVTVDGEANFNVAKDVAKPFTVYSNSVVITVLGTRFTVKSYDANNATKVILHEGRVMVKIAAPSSRDTKNEYYLTLGDIFILKKVKAQVRTTNAERIATSSTILHDSLSVRILHLEKDKDDCYLFDNHPLDVVFDQLQIIYNTKIIYNKAELGNRSFIGKIDKKDSLSHILKSIALLNNFSLHQQGDSFLISNNPY
jgi:transmembrane sensor